MDIRFDEGRKKGKSPTTRLYAPKKNGAKAGRTRTEAEPASRRPSDSHEREEQKAHVRVHKPELNPLSRVGLIFCGFVFSGMVLFTLTGYERITRAYADINSLNTEIDETELRINELDVQIECAVTIQEAQQVAEEYGMQYPEKSQYVRIGDALPFSGASLAADDAATTDQGGDDAAPSDGTGGAGDTTDGGEQPSDGG